ncbi:hypothetical protein CGRA01v4_08738 [Colletotrichum graminicola]|nr:hypothetical protein CGRA01v4_08738 [Colletotrichum graminicola]
MRYPNFLLRGTTSCFLVLEGGFGNQDRRDRPTFVAGALFAILTHWDPSPGDDLICGEFCS